MTTVNKQHIAARVDRRGRSRTGILPDTQKHQVEELAGTSIEEGLHKMSIFGGIIRGIKGWILSTAPAQGWRVASIHSALQRGQVAVHNIRPVGAASYIVQIGDDNNLDIERVANAWTPGLLQRVWAGKNNSLLMDVRRNEFMNALQIGMADQTTQLLNSGLMPPDIESFADVGEPVANKRKSKAVVAHDPQPTFAVLLSTLLRAAGLNVAECEELGDGGFGTRYFALSVS